MLRLVKDRLDIQPPGIGENPKPVVVVGTFESSEEALEYVERAKERTAAPFIIGGWDLVLMNDGSYWICNHGTSREE